MSALTNLSTRLSLLIRVGVMILTLSVLMLSCSTGRKQPVADYPDSQQVVKAMDQKQSTSSRPEQDHPVKNKHQKQAGADYPDSHRTAKTVDRPQAGNIEQRILDQYHTGKAPVIDWGVPAAGVSTAPVLSKPSIGMLLISICPAPL